MATVPGIMLDIGANVARMQGDMRSLTQVVENSFGRMGQVVRTFGGIFAGALSLGALESMAKSSIQAYMEQEEAENKLAVAMKNMGTFTAEAHAALVKYAEEVQRTTAITDDAALGVMGLLKTFGMSDEVLQKTTRAVLDLSIGMGTDLTSAAHLLGKAFLGHTTALTRHGIVVDETKRGAEKYAAVLEQIQQRFGGSAVAQLDTYSGRWKNLKNAMGEAAEAVGKVLLDYAFGGPIIDAQTAALQRNEEIWTGIQHNWSPEKIEDLRKMGDAWEYLTSKVEHFKPVSEDTLKATEKLAEAVKKMNLEISVMGMSDVQKKIALIAQETEEYKKAAVDQVEIEKFVGARRHQILAENKQKDLEAGIEAQGKEYEAYLEMLDRVAVKTAEIQLKQNADEKRAIEENIVAQGKAYDDWLEQLNEGARAEGQMQIDKNKLFEKLYDENAEAFILAQEKMLEAQGEIARVGFEREKTVSLERLQAEIKIYEELRTYGGQHYDAQVKMLERLGKDYRNLGVEEVAVAAWVAQEKLKASHLWSDGAIRGLNAYAAGATNAAKNVEEMISRSFKGMEDALVEFVKTGKLNFTSLVDSMIADLIRLMVRQNITGPLAGSMSGWGSLFSAFFGGGSAGAVNQNPAAWGGQSAAMMHGGGIIGMSQGMSKSLPAVFLAAAPRYHGGLQPDEFPTILKRGEGVFTPEQMKAMGNRTDIAIHIPISMPGMDTRKSGRMQRDLEAEIGPVVRKIVEGYI